MSNLVKVTLHHHLGEEIGKEWNLNVSSVSEAIRAIESNTKKLYKCLLNKEKENTKYRILINGEDFLCEKKGTLGIEDINHVKNSELMMKSDSLKSIDIVPVLEGNNNALGIITTILGVLLIAVGFILTFYINPVLGYGMIIAGIGLLAAGVTSLLTRPPKFEDFRQQPNGQLSYLFSGPQNTTQEGGPVPVGYGKLLVGSQVISAAYLIQEYDVDTGITTNNLTTSSLKQKQNFNPGLPVTPIQQLGSPRQNNNPNANINTLNYAAINSGVNPSILISNNISGALIDNNVNII